MLVISSLSSFWNSLITSNRHADPSSSKLSYHASHKRNNSFKTDSLQSVVTISDKDVHLSHQHFCTSGNLSQHSNIQATSLDSTYTHAVPYSNMNHWPGLRFAMTYTLTPPAYEQTDIVLQDYGTDGLLPPPPVSDSWRRIDRWAQTHYPELYDQLSYGATVADVDELEHELECHLPRDVRESFFIHDGQERGGKPTGIVFGVTLLDCEELLEEYCLWKKVATDLTRIKTSNPFSRCNRLLKRQGSCPEGAVRPVYAHPKWIPLGKDFEGNNIAVDLAPGPTGRWGQVILFGRDQDIKCVVAQSWASFLAILADDLEEGDWTIDDTTGELFLGTSEKDRTSYFDILKSRVHKRQKQLSKPMLSLVNSNKMSVTFNETPTIINKSDTASVKIVRDIDTKPIESLEVLPVSVKSTKTTKQSLTALKKNTSITPKVALAIKDANILKGTEIQGKSIEIQETSILKENTVSN
ncbi:unnamed protein product [Pneumocystis jirovecii]|uniref:Knr4/Smi1-like domain-containing protein n=2 Tax=Pneumocystis jirovecii TaxID=42068 RepID=L0PD21_PNEJI|nr:uncharacterized protein T551_00030 [Pneumocystis jirovecii RU7]KTW32545.1 hypothetical protein T551_00030 [Pneumocystis jirovecii RU7]CCJ29984.1 unnamed protein product [Pneumocystis jirovecii]CCJ30258.1 unnamed protein product [Pneumocystis jirovecii]